MQSPDELAYGWPPRPPQPLFDDNPFGEEPKTKYRCRGCDHHFEAFLPDKCPLCDDTRLVVRK